MLKLRTILLSILFAAFALAHADSEWKQYPYQAPGSDILFPQDEGRHIMFPNLEWWYLVIHAKGETTGHDYSILVTHFNNKFRFFSISDINEGTHLNHTARGKLNSKRRYLDLSHSIIKNSSDIFRSKRDPQGELIPFEYEVKTHGKNFSLSTSLRALKPPMMIGGNGYVPIGKSGHSWYYSLTRLQARGSLNFDGRKENFSGTAWIDHQWGPFFVSPVQVGKLFESYEWFCLQLEDGTDMMISNVFDRDNKLPEGIAYRSLHVNRPDGTSHFELNHRFERTRFFPRPDKEGEYLSMGWRLIDEKSGIDLELTPFSTSHMVDFPLGGSFYEGPVKVFGHINGKEIVGRGFAELLHNFKTPKLSLSKLRRTLSLSNDLRINWKVTNPDEGNPLHFDLSLVDSENQVLMYLKTDKTEAVIKAKELEVALGNTKKINVKVEAYSVDRTIKGEKISKSIVVTP